MKAFKIYEQVMLCMGGLTIVTLVTLLMARWILG